MLVQDLPDGYLLFKNFVCDSDKNLFGNVNHLIFIDVHGLIRRVLTVVILLGFGTLLVIVRVAELHAGALLVVRV